MEATLEWQRRLRELIPNAAERGALRPMRVVMEATLEWQRRLRELIPNAAERGALRPMLRMRPEEVLSISDDDDDDAVRASLQQIRREATLCETVISMLQSLVPCLPSCFSGGRTPEPTPLDLLPPSSRCVFDLSEPDNLRQILLHARYIYSSSLFVLPVYM